MRYGGTRALLYSPQAGQYQPRAAHSSPPVPQIPGIRQGARTRLERPTKEPSHNRQHSPTNSHPTTLANTLPRRKKLLIPLRKLFERGERSRDCERGKRSAGNETSFIEGALLSVPRSHFFHCRPSEHDKGDLALLTKRAAPEGAAVAFCTQSDTAIKRLGSELGELGLGEERFPFPRAQHVGTINPQTSDESRPSSRRGL
jgi:hypothetical protein